jgi:hypothetical protein
VRTRFAFGQHSFLVGFRQKDVAVSATVDVHEHLLADKKCVFVDSGIFFLRQSELSTASLRPDWHAGSKFFDAIPHRGSSQIFG